VARRGAARKSYGTFNACKYAAAYLAKNQPDEHGLRGVLINVASVAAIEGQKGQVAYAASKGAVTQMTLPMARGALRCASRASPVRAGGLTSRWQTWCVVSKDRLCAARPGALPRASACGARLTASSAGLVRHPRQHHLPRHL